MLDFINKNQNRSEIKSIEEIKTYILHLIGLEEKDSSEYIQLIESDHRCGRIQLKHGYYSSYFLKNFLKFVDGEDSIFLISGCGSGCNAGLTCSSGIEINWFSKGWY